MVIKLKNGKNVDINWNFMFLEFLEEYPGGFKGLKSDYDKHINLMKIHNHLLYAAIRSNLEEPLTYRETLFLVRPEDSQNIIDYVFKNFQEMDAFKKKDVKYVPMKKKKK